MDITNVKVGTLCIPDDVGIPLDNRMQCAIKCLEASDKGFKFLRCNPYYNSEEFFLNCHALSTSHWMIAPKGIDKSDNLC